MCILFNQSAQVKAKIPWILISSLVVNFLCSQYKIVERAGRKPDSQGQFSCDHGPITEILQDSVSHLWSGSNYRAFRWSWDNYVRKYHEHFKNRGPRYIKLLLLYSYCLISPHRNAAISWNTTQWHNKTLFEVFKELWRWKDAKRFLHRRSGGSWIYF